MLVLERVDNWAWFGLFLLRVKLFELLLHELVKNIEPVLLAEPIDDSSLNQVLDEQGRLKPVAHSAA